MISHLVLAGGRATRLFGPQGGCKPLLQLGDGTVLMDYCIHECGDIPVGERIVIVSDETNGPIQHHLLRSEPVPRILTQRATGTGPAVAALMGATCADSVLLTTSDIAGRSGALRSFYRGSLARLQEQSGPICLVAVGPTAPEEDSPIYVHYDYSGRVHAYGKGIEPSVRSFASARVLNGEFRDAYLKHWEPSLTDTQTMTKVLTSLPGSIVAVEVDAIFDVDEIQSLKRARALKAVDRLGHAARQDRWVRPDQLPEVGNRGRGEDA